MVASFFCDGRIVRERVEERHVGVDVIEVRREIGFTQTVEVGLRGGVELEGQDVGQGMNSIQQVERRQPTLATMGLSRSWGTQCRFLWE